VDRVLVIVSVAWRHEEYASDATTATPVCFIPSPCVAHQRFGEHQDLTDSHRPDIRVSKTKAQKT